MSERLWIMVDIECSGPIIGRHSMTELGAVVGSRERGIFGRFEALIAPLNDEPAKASRKSHARALTQGQPAAEAMRAFAAWTRQFERPSFIARPACFDWPWIVWYAWTFLGDNPFGFKAVCASSWFEGRGKIFKVDLPHIAVEDAALQLELFLR